MFSFVLPQTDIKDRLLIKLNLNMIFAAPPTKRHNKIQRHIQIDKIRA